MSSPCTLKTGLDSPVMDDSLNLARPSMISPSVGTISLSLTSTGAANSGLLDYTPAGILGILFPMLLNDPLGRNREILALNYQEKITENRNNKIEKNQ